MKLIVTIALIAMGSVAAMASAPEGQTQPAAPAKPAAAAPAGEPEHIQVQHILIGFQGSVPGKNITRSQDEAKKLAYEILERAKKGEDFGAMVKQYTDDAFPGIYGMSNNGVQPGPGEHPRRGMVPAFGDTGFPLKAGEVGIADFDTKKSPYGWHIVKRIK